MHSAKYYSVYEELYGHISTLKTIDTHEHLPAYESWRCAENDVLSEFLTHYFSCDLISSGLPAEVLDKEIRPVGLTVAEKWRRIAPYWRASMHTGYGRALRIAAREIYGIDRIDADTIEELDRRFAAARAAGGHYKYVLKDKCNIEISVLDGWTEVADGDYFRIAAQINPFIYGDDGDILKSAVGVLGRDIVSFSDYLDGVSEYIENILKEKAACLKCSLAYNRSLHYGKPDYESAQTEFDAVQRGAPPEVCRDSVKLQDYMMHHILKLCDRLGAVVQFHTGIQEGNGNRLEWTNPILMTNLFLEYPNVRFDLFHIGYPFHNITAALAKNFRNVYIDMCWAHIISPAASVAALDEFLDSVPYNKISAFGGDYCFVDAVYGHLLMARDNVARTLASKVCGGVFDIDEAKHIAACLFYDNPKSLFGL